MVTSSSFSVRLISRHITILWDAGRKVNGKVIDLYSNTVIPVPIVFKTLSSMLGTLGSKEFGCCLNAVKIRNIPRIPRATRTFPLLA